MFIYIYVYIYICMYLVGVKNIVFHNKFISLIKPHLMNFE